MKKELENFIIQSDYKIDYFDDIVNYIIENEKDILGFFNLKKLSNKFSITIMKYENFKEEEIKRFGEVISYIRGITSGKNNEIIVLDIDDQKEYTKHKNATLEDTLKMILHEVVHACNLEINKDSNRIVWFKEGLATNLANQSYPLIDLNNCDFELLKNNFNKYGKNNYAYAHTIVNYILNNYEKDEIDKLISNSDYLRKKSNEIFLEAKDYASNIRLSK